VCIEEEKEERKRREKWREKGGVFGWEGREGEKEKKERERERVWVTCQCVSGWEEISLSSPSQPCANIWQSEISLILNAQTFINYIRTPLFKNPIF
jgi:hypothetical protein